MSLLTLIGHVHVHVHACLQLNCERNDQEFIRLDFLAPLLMWHITLSPMVARTNEGRTSEKASIQVTWQYTERRVRQSICCFNWCSHFSTCIHNMSIFHLYTITLVQLDVLLTHLHCICQKTTCTCTCTSKIHCIDVATKNLRQFLGTPGIVHF